MSWAGQRCPNWNPFRSTVVSVVSYLILLSLSLRCQNANALLKCAIFVVHHTSLYLCSLGRDIASRSCFAIKPASGWAVILDCGQLTTTISKHVLVDTENSRSWISLIKKSCLVSFFNGLGCLSLTYKITFRCFLFPTRSGHVDYFTFIVIVLFHR